MASLSDPKPALQSRLDAAAAAQTKDWWERYLKGAIEFRGVPMAGIRAAVHSWYADLGLGQRRNRKGQRDLAFGLIREPLAEDKLAGILMLQEILIPERRLRCGTDLAGLAALFDEGYVADWSTCDWLCVRVLGPVAAQQGEGCARAIAGWSAATNLWRARAGGVAFVNLAPAGDANFPGFVAMVLAACRRNVQRRERFAQTGVGWVLRELSVAAPEAVAVFATEHIAVLSREAIRSAVRKLDADTSAAILAAHKARRRHG